MSTVTEVAHQRAQLSSLPGDVPWRERPFLQLGTAADLIGVSKATVYKFEADGRLIFKRLGGRTLVETASLIRLIDSAEEWTASQQGAAARSRRSERAAASWAD